MKCIKPLNFNILHIVYVFKDPESWIATNMAGLYWRIEGKSENALDCLRHALHYAPPDMKVSLIISQEIIFID